MSDYDAIVVGSGLGGLAAAARLARSGRRVLVAERADGPGGYAHAFTREGRYFDPAIHVVPGAGPGGTIDAFLDFLGVQCDFVESDLLYRVVIGDETLDAPFGMKAFVEAHVRKFPHQAAGIRAYFALCERFLTQAHQLPPHLSVRELANAVDQFPEYFAHRLSTVEEVVSRYIADPKCAAFCTAGWPYMGLPPSRLSFDLFARFLFTQMHGLYHCVGGFQNLVNAFVEVIEKNDGTILLDTTVDRIVVENGRATGIEFAGGRITAPAVISNADARHTLENLVGLANLPSAYIRKFRKLRPSMSMFVVYAASKVIPIPGTHETFVFTGPDHDATFAGFEGGMAPAAVVAVPTLLDPTLAPAGEHLFISTALAPYQPGMPWPDLKPVLQERYLALVERIYPGFRDGLTFVQSATPLTLQRYTLNDRGAAYGWENTAGSKRLSYKTPIEGLYLAGHWSQAASALRVIVSGSQVAQDILGEPDGGPTL